MTAKKWSGTSTEAASSSVTKAAPPCWEREADYASVVRNIYRSPAPSRYLGSLAPFILEHRGDAYVDALIDRNFRNLFERTLVRYDRLPVGVVGGFGCACRAELERLGAEYGLTFTRFIPSPMEGLITYHGV